MSYKESDQERKNSNYDPFLEERKGSISERLIELAKTRTIRETAKLWGVSTATVSLYTKKGGMPSLDRSIVIANNEGVSLNWLAMGIDDDKKTASTTHERILEKPKYNVAASAGGGSFIDTETPVEYYPFTYSFLKRRRLLHADLCVIEAYGDSMEPTLESGDDLLLKLMPELSDKPLEGVYVINIDNQLRVKRLEYSMAKDGYRIISDNNLYPEEFIDRDDLERMNVIGEVVMVMGTPSKGPLETN